MATIVKRPEFLNINDYIKHLRQFKRTGIIKPGFLYSYIYRFDKNPKFKKKPYDEQKFYDYMPATFVFHVTENTFFGLNFHHLPLLVRQIWLGRVRRMYEDNFLDTEPDRIPLNWNLLKSILLKASKFSVRQYRFDRLTDLRIVTEQDWERTFRFYARTYFGVTLRAVENKYKLFRV